MKFKFKSRFIATLAFTLLLGATVSAIALYPQQDEKGRWGYVNDEGKVIIKYQYDEAEEFVNGLAKVRKGNNVGFIDTDNKAPDGFKYNLIENYAPGIRKVAKGGSYKDGILKGEKYGFIKTNGDVIIKPEYDEIGSFENGVARVKKGNKYGYINERFDFIVPCEFFAVGSFGTSDFVWVAKGGKLKKGSSTEFTGSNYGIYNKEGKVIIPAKYKMVGTFNKHEEITKQYSRYDSLIMSEAGPYPLMKKYASDDHFFSKLKPGFYGFFASNNSYGYENSVVSPEGEIIIKEKTYKSALYPQDGLSLVSIDKKKNYGMNYLNVNSGKLLLETSLKSLWGLKNNVAIASDNNGTFLINNQGIKLSEYYEKIFPETEGVYIVKRNKKYGVIDSNGIELTEPSFALLLPSSNNLLVARKDERSENNYGYVDRYGTFRVKPVYSLAKSFKPFGALVGHNARYGMIDTLGNEIVNVEYVDIKVPQVDNPENLWVQKDDFWHYLNIASGKYVFDRGFSDAKNFDIVAKDVALVAEIKESGETLMGAINAKGDVIIPLDFNSWDIAEEAYNYFVNSGKTEWKSIDSYRFNILYSDEIRKVNLNSIIESKLWDY